jgi:hypothetical protein
MWASDDTPTEYTLSRPGIPESFRIRRHESSSLSASPTKLGSEVLMSPFPIRLSSHSRCHLQLFLVHSSLLFDPKKLEFLSDVTIAVNSRDGSIEDVYPRRGDSIPEISDHDIDLRGKVVMPGFVDSHTHIFLHDHR